LSENGYGAARPLHLILSPDAKKLSVPQKGPNVQDYSLQSNTPEAPIRPSIRARAGAAGKALIVYLASGSIGVALVAFLLFKVMGC
jgi:hypothetical protein